MPLWLLLIPYAIIFALFLLFSVFNFFHLLRYGFFTFPAALFLILYVGTALAILLWTTQTLAGTEWSQSLFIMEGFPINAF